MKASKQTDRNGTRVISEHGKHPEFVSYRLSLDLIYALRK